MEDIVNFIIAVIAAFVMGLASHSIYLHSEKRRDKEELGLQRAIASDLLGSLGQKQEEIWTLQETIRKLEDTISEFRYQGVNIDEN